MNTSVEQVADWMNHPEKYNIQTDEEFAWFVAWTELTCEMNELANRKAGEISPDDLKNPSHLQIIERVNRLRGRPNN